MIRSANQCRCWLTFWNLSLSLFDGEKRLPRVWLSLAVFAALTSTLAVTTSWHPVSLSPSVNLCLVFDPLLFVYNTYI